KRRRVPDLSRIRSVNREAGVRHTGKGATPFDRRGAAERRNERGEISRGGGEDPPPRQADGRGRRDGTLRESAHPRHREAARRKPKTAREARANDKRRIVPQLPRSRSNRRREDRLAKSAPADSCGRSLSPYRQTIFRAAHRMAP